MIVERSHIIGHIDKTCKYIFLLYSIMLIFNRIHSITIMLIIIFFLVSYANNKIYYQ
jgi:energy-coupling factor transporter transmembrane protein EcfT